MIGRRPLKRGVKGYQNSSSGIRRGQLVGEFSPERTDGELAPELVDEFVPERTVGEFSAG